MEYAKQIALGFLHTPITENQFSPITVDHPIFETALMMNPVTKELVNILENEESLNNIISKMEEKIERATSYEELFLIVRKSYRFTFFKFIKDELTEKEFSRFLSYVWTISENPNQDTNVSLKEAVEYFRSANKQYLMSEEERTYLKSLPDTVTVYRGVAKGRNPDGLSWTDSYETAKWFADRWHSNGEIRRGVVLKKDILAYFNGRDENELVIPTEKINFK